MPQLRQIALNNNAGAFVDVLASIPVCFWEAMEDEVAAMQGLQVKTLTDNFATTNIFSGASEPIQYPNVHRYPQPPGGPLQGLPAQGTVGAFNYRAADKLISARSNGAASALLRFLEYE